MTFKTIDADPTEQFINYSDLMICMRRRGFTDEETLQGLGIKSVYIVADVNYWLGGDWTEDLVLPINRRVVYQDLRKHGELS